jgi:hypothetical protein
MLKLQPMNKPAPAPELELSPAASLGMVAVGLIIFWFCLHKDIDRAGYIPHWTATGLKTNRGSAKAFNPSQLPARSYRFVAPPKQQAQVPTHSL